MPFGASPSQILQCFQIIDDVCQGCPYAFATPERRQVREFFAFTDRQCQRALTDPRLLDLYVVRNILDQLVNRRMVLPVSCETRSVKEIDDGLLLQQ